MTQTCRTKESALRVVVAVVVVVVVLGDVVVEVVVVVVAELRRRSAGRNAQCYRATTPVMNVEQVVRRIVVVALLATCSPGSASAGRDRGAVVTYLSLVEQRETRV